MVTGNRRKDGFFDKTWVVIATAAGVLIVVVCALVFYVGGSGDPAGLASPGAAVTPASSGQPGVLTYGVAPTIGYEPTVLVVPDKGVFIKVSYRGGYEGRYTSGNETQELRNSGEQVFKLENPGPTVSATVKKQDGSAKQALTLEIWKDGTRLVTNTTSLPFGEVTVSGNI